MYCLVCVLLLLFCVNGERGFYKEAPSPWPSVILSELPHKYISVTDLPTYFDWRDNYLLTPPTNQFLPYPCGSCWAHASTGALTDRFIINTKGKTSIPQLSMQVLLDCGYETLDSNTEIGSCEGGSDILAYQFIYQYGITDITCSPYMGVAFTNWGESTPCYERMCRDCDIYGNCQFVNGTMYYVSEYGSLSGEQDMMSEIYTRGPIACSVYAHTDNFLKYKTGIISDPTDYNITTHVIAVTGWGMDEDTGTKYWIGRNSFGTIWGEGGWFKLERGKNTLNIERHPCAWAVPKL